MKTTLNYKMENENYPKPCISPNYGTQEGIYSHQGRGPGGQPLAQNAGAAASVRPRKHCLGRVFTAIRWPLARRFEPRAVPSVPCQLLLPVSRNWPLVLTESAS